VIGVRVSWDHAASKGLGTKHKAPWHNPRTVPLCETESSLPPIALFLLCDHLGSKLINSKILLELICVEAGCENERRGRRTRP
jgi:hypothetical protein